MQTQEYMTLSRASGDIGDQFYRCLTEWLRSRGEHPSSDCREIGRQYSEALTRQRRYLNSLPADPKRDAAINSCETYIASLNKSLCLLDAPLKDAH